MTGPGKATPKASDVKPEPSTRDVLVGLALMVVLFIGFAYAVQASQKQDKARLAERCATEGTAQWRGNVDNERALAYIKLCR